MNWNLSELGEKLSAHTGINGLMQDLGEAMAGSRSCLMLGGGNPAHIPEVERLWRGGGGGGLGGGGGGGGRRGGGGAGQGRPGFFEGLAG
ncbi:MAG TPA: valine--pyruvate transaminase, partial [Kiritimatiellia bacterium]|nr:valine--pyruvate transaminase [Kiritimatiellia bacterium]